MRKLNIVIRELNNKLISLNTRADFNMKNKDSVTHEWTFNALTQGT